MHIFFELIVENVDFGVVPQATIISFYPNVY